VKHDVCIIGVDRPGVGLSTFRPGYGLLDWPRDVNQLATHLEFAEFRVLGGSGGGPYALACAYMLPSDVLKATGVMAGLAPREAGHKGLSWERYIGFIINILSPSWLLHWTLETGLCRHARDPDQTYWRKIINDGMIKTLPASDRTLFNDASIEAMTSQIRDACLGGAAGYVQDAKHVLGKWPFDVKDIKGKVSIFNGTADTDTPVHGARWMRERIPGATLREFEGESHLSVFVKKQEEIFTDLMAS
jgi:pimeloyl-ACP methyl ester carboxylesterase